MLLHLAFIVCLGVQIVHGGWAAGHVGVSREGEDLPNMPVALALDSQPSDCRQLCADTLDGLCKSWIFLRENCRSPQLGSLIRDNETGTQDSTTESATCWLKRTVSSQLLDPCAVSGVMDLNLVPAKFKHLPTGAIKPTGWLRDQLLVQANGLTGHLSDFWPFLNQSVWIGGTIDMDQNQNVPYWLNGLVPLAYQLDDPHLLAQVWQYIDYILTHIQPDGWLGPPAKPHDGSTYWGRFPLLLALTQYYEANSSDSRVIPAIVGHLKSSYVKMHTVALSSWAAARYQDMVLVCHWLLDNKYTDEVQQIWDIADLAHSQGFTWEQWYGTDEFPTEAVQKTTMYTHGVNNAQAIKSGAVWYRQSDNTGDIQSSYTRMEKLDKYHSMASGMFSADEHLAGLMPSRGIELCAVVEAIYSYNVVFSVTGDPVFAEHAEMIAYNALPATFTKDMWAHQYLQQPNEMNAIHSPDHVWGHDGPDATLYGLAPNFRCCTANYHQGWPKYTSNMVMATSDAGLIVSSWGPVSVVTENINITVVTDYPFGDNATVVINPRFREEFTPIYIRIPSWSNNTVVVMDDVPQENVTAGSILKTSCMGTECRITVQFDMALRLQRRFNDAAAIYRGPLLYSLSMIENYDVLHHYAFKSADYQVTAKSAWNYALYLPSDADLKKVVTFVQGPMPTSGAGPYYLPTVPVHLTAKGQLLSSWSLAHNAAAPPPTSPLPNNGSAATLDSIVLLPYGSTCLRIAEMPTVTLTK